MIIRILLLLTLMFGSVNVRADVTTSLDPFTPGSVGFTLALTGNHPYFNYVHHKDSTSVSKESDNNEFNGIRVFENNFINIFFTVFICLVFICLMIFIFNFEF